MSDRNKTANCALPPKTADIALTTFFSTLNNQRLIKWFWLFVAFNMWSRKMSPRLTIPLKSIKISIVWKRFSIPQKFKVVEFKDVNNTDAIFGCYEEHVFNTNKIGIFWRIMKEAWCLSFPCQICTAGKFLDSSTKTVNDFSLISEVNARWHFKWLT